jgi:DNA-binding transcriptional ArsR family regulator
MSFIESADEPRTPDEGSLTADESRTPGEETQAAEPGSPENPLEITDPRALRALAHPARIAIMQHLALEGPATATDCAGVTGLSPSACSYHLRALAKYGFVEEVSSADLDRRHRPWRARVVAIEVGRDPDRPEAARVAGRLLVESLEARGAEMRAAYLDREAEYPAEWQRAVGTSQDVLHVTAAELTEIKSRITRILGGYRRLRPQDQPADARRVHAIVDFLPWFSPDDPARPAGLPGSTQG